MVLAVLATMLVTWWLRVPGRSERSPASQAKKPVRPKKKHNAQPSATPDRATAAPAKTAIAPAPAIPGVPDLEPQEPWDPRPRGTVLRIVSKPPKESAPLAPAHARLARSTSGSEEDEDDGWTVVRPAAKLKLAGTSSGSAAARPTLTPTSPTAGGSSSLRPLSEPEPLTKKQRENLRKAERLKVAKLEQERQQQARLAQHRAEQFHAKVHAMPLLPAAPKPSVWRATSRDGEADEDMPESVTTPLW